MADDVGYDSKGKGKDSVNPSLASSELTNTMKSSSFASPRDFSGRARGCGTDMTPYGQLNLNKTAAEMDPEQYTIKYGDLKDYMRTNHEYVGEGSYGQVTTGRQVSTGRMVALKYIKTEKLKMKSVRREVMMLNAVKGGPNIIEFIDIVRHDQSGQIVLIFEHIEDAGWTDGRYFMSLPEAKKKSYLFKVLQALDYTHSQGIIHCDLKSGNILYNPVTGDVRLIDFAFGTYYHPDHPMRRFPGTRTWKAPEMMLRHEGYSYPVDMWAYGCLVCHVVLGYHPFRAAAKKRGKAVVEDYPAHMERIMAQLGTEDLFPYIEKYGMTINNSASSRGVDLRAAQAAPRTPRRPFGENLSAKARAAVADGLDLLDRLLVYDHHARLTAPQALAHPYFDGMS